MPYCVSPRGLVHRADCHLAEGDLVFEDRSEALARGRRAAVCCMRRAEGGALGPAWL